MIYKVGLERGMEIENQNGHPAIWNVKDGLIIMKVAKDN